MAEHMFLRACAHWRNLLALPSADAPLTNLADRALNLRREMLVGTESRIQELGVRRTLDSSS